MRRLFFRPYPGITVAVVVLLALLLGLGFWQLQRLQWKLALIAQVNANLTAPPLSLDHALASGAAAEYRRVALDGRFDNAREAYIYGIGPEGAPVFHVIVPFATDDGHVLLVDRGIVPRDMQNPATRREGIRNGETRVVGVWRRPEAGGAFTPPPDVARRIWFAHDLAAIARADGIRLAAPVIVEADATPNPGGWPRGGQTVVSFRNEHLQYAITWFLMAAGLLGVYIAYHVSRGRLGLQSRD